MKKKKNYTPPQCRSIKLLVESFICTSTKVNQTNSNEEEWKSEENLIITLLRFNYKKI
mgnify:CR=1 FL=1